MDVERPLNPTQHRVLTELMATGMERPVFDSVLPARLLDLLEDGLAPVAPLLGTGELVVGKHDLAQVLQCERMAMASQRKGFAWSPRTACGTVAHKAIELSAFTADDPTPLDLVDRALSRILDAAEPWGPADYLEQADEADRAEVRAGANDLVAKFLDDFPPLKRQWRPVLESHVRIDLFDGRIVLKGKVDLALGRRDATRARVLIVDFKARTPHHAHVDDLRFYALLDTIRSGVPPFRVASYYLDAARSQHEDVTEDVLEAAAHRVIQGVTRMVELRIGGRPPLLHPGPACGFCSERHECEGALRWSEQQADIGLVGTGAGPDRSDHARCAAPIGPTTVPHVDCQSLEVVA
jgi:hypothetical protein